MKTWHEMMTDLGNIDTYEHYTGSTAHKHMYMCLSRRRDSSILENSNFEVALKMLGGESDTVKVLSFNHWAFGWIEHIMIDPSDQKAVQIGNEIQDSLNEYPILDDIAFGMKQEEEWNETFSFTTRSDIVNYIEKIEYEAETHLFTDEDGNVELSDEEEELLYKIATDNAALDNYESWETKVIAKEFIEEAVYMRFPTHPDLFDNEETPIVDNEIIAEKNRLLAEISKEKKARR